VGFPENEVAADNQQREFEELSRTPGGKLVTGAKNLISLVPGAGPIANAIGLSKIMMNMGLSTVEENIDFLGKATAAALDRIERKLETQGVCVEEIAQKYHGHEFAASIEAVVLQTQRTRQKTRLD
jgi:phospholipid N-methyltransferase